jgi:ferritin-like metal-binding protein YciE
MIIREKSGRKRAKNISINDKIALYLNDALSVENAAIKRLQLRLRQTRLADIKEQLQHHLDETKEQQNRLKRLISSLGQKPTNDRGRLPVMSSPISIEKMLMTNTERKKISQPQISGQDSDAICLRDRK